MQIGNNKQILKSGDIGFCFPNIIHGFSKCDSDEECNIYNILIAPEISGMYRKKLLESTTDSPFIKSEDVNEDIIYAVNSIIKFADSNDSEAVSIYFNLLLLHLFRIIDITENHSSVNFDLVQQIFTYISQNYLEPINLDSIAKALHISKYQISRVMSSKLHTSLPKYLNQMRINHSIELLERTDLTITEVSEQCGFESERTFHRVFKNEFNTEPRKVRENFRNSSI